MSGKVQSWARAGKSALSRPWLAPLQRLRSGPALAWAAAVLAVLALGLAVLLPERSGPVAFILSFGVAAVLLVVFYAMASGNLATQTLSPEGVAAAQRQTDFALEALRAAPEALLVTGRRGEPVFANHAYQALVKATGQASQSTRLTPFERLAGAHPGLSAICFRLTRAARLGQPVSESLPAFEGASGMFALDVHILPLSSGQALWRIVERQPRAGGDLETGLSQSGLSLLDDAPAGFFSVDRKGRVSYMNNTLRQWLGLGDEPQNITLKHFVPGEARRLLNRNVKGAVSTAVRLKTRDGIECPAMISITWPSRPRDAHGRAVVLGTAKGQAPAGVARTREPVAARAGRALDEMFMAAPFGVARLDMADPGMAIIEDVNPALLEMTNGHARPGTPFLSLFAESEAQGPGPLSALEEEGSGPFELALAGTGDKTVNLYIARDQAGRAIVYLIDMSAWKDLQTRLFQAQKVQVIGQLVAGVAHDLNNVLTIIGGVCDDLLSRHTIGDPSYPDLQKINENVARASALVENLLAYSRQKTVRAVPLDLTAVLSEFTYMLKRILHDNIELDVTHGRDLPTVRMDKGQLEMAVMNLATNARDAMLEKGGGHLSIRTSRQDELPAHVRGEAEAVPDGAWALIEVIDDGPGMSADVLAKIFEPFFTTKDLGKGTGLGLANVQGIIQQSGGFLYPQSAPGQGTTFQIWLPQCLDPVVSAPPKAGRKPKDMSGQGCILFVEDEDGLREIAVKTLKNRGYEVLDAADGEEALQIARENAGRIDLMVSDVVMPGMDGPDMLEQARDYLSETRIVFTSGFAEGDFSKVLSADTQISFLPKPYKLKQLAELVKAEIGESSRP